MAMNRTSRGVILAMVLAAGCGSSGSVEGSEAPRETLVPSTSRIPAASGREPASEAPTESPPPSLIFDDIELAGEGDKVPKFTTPDRAISIAEATHKGERNFAIATIDAAGEQLDLLVNTVGNYQGTVLFDMESGYHSAAFEVTADGAWTITVKPVADAPKWDLSGKLNGSGDAVYLVSPPSSGLVTLDITNDGERNFAVIAYTILSGDVLVNEVGNYSGQVLLPDETVLLEITTDGAWSLTPG
jgi:hypothetical protein